MADIYTTTPAIADNDLVVLEETRRITSSPSRSCRCTTSQDDGQGQRGLNAVSKLLTTERGPDQPQPRVGGSQKQNPKDAAAAWLKDKGLVK